MSSGASQSLKVEVERPPLEQNAMSPETVAQLFPVEAPAATPFYIAATQQSATRLPRALKCDDTFIVLDARGDIAATSGGSAGLFHLDTRYLSRLEVLVNAACPLLLDRRLVQREMDRLDLDDFREALEHAPPGIIDERSWAYWNTVIGRYPAPPMPRRIIPA
jgi:hypothetical protein